MAKQLAAVLGTGQTKYVAKRKDVSMNGLVREAIDRALADSGSTFDDIEAVVVGNHVTATLNGKKVHDNALLPAVTGGAMDNDELSPGPVMIQGDHSKIAVRKLVVTPITTPGT